MSNRVTQIVLEAFMDDYPIVRPFLRLFVREVGNDHTRPI